MDTMDPTTYMESLADIDLSTLGSHDRTCRICLVDFGVQNEDVRPPTDSEIEAATPTTDPRIEDATPATEAENAPEKAVRLGCGHLFGRACISAWLESNNTCPTCRGTVIENRARPSHSNHPAIAAYLFTEQLDQLMAIAHGNAAGFTMESMGEHFGDEIRQRFVNALANGTDSLEALYHQDRFLAVHGRYHHRFGLTMAGVMNFWTLAISDEISDEWWIFVREDLIGSYLLALGRHEDEQM